MTKRNGNHHMWTIAEMKARGRAAFRANYWSCVIVGFLLIILAAGSAAANSQNRPEVSPSEMDSTTAIISDGYSRLSPQAQAALLSALIGGVLLIMLVSLLLKIFVFNPLTVGGYHFFKRNIGDPTTRVGTVLEGFEDYGRTFVTLLLTDVLLILWSLLFVIPGIVKAYSYRMVPYIVKDEPDLSPTEVITRSRQMMDGNKGQAFLMDLSFLGWYILGALTLGLVDILWAIPYRESANAALYLELSRK